MKEKNNLVIIGILLIFFLFWFLFGWWGVKIGVMWLTLFVVLPFYVLMLFDFDLIERIILSFFLGFGLLSTLVYWPAFLIGSIKITVAIFAIAIIVISSALILWRKNEDNAS